MILKVDSFVPVKIPKWEDNSTYTLVMTLWDAEQSIWLKFEFVTNRD